MPPPINAEDIPELVYPHYRLASEPPADQYEMMREIDKWADEQVAGDTDLKAYGLAWLALDELTRIKYCEAYLPEREDR